MTIRCGPTPSWARAATQRSSGEWLERMEAHNGPAYQTAIAVLILSVPSHYLPIYQR